MKFGIVGLGRMGVNLAQRAAELGHEPVGYDASEEGRRRAEALSVTTAESLNALVDALAGPRIVLLYVPHGQPTEDVCRALKALLKPHDIVVDGGNSHWDDSKRRYASFAEVGVRFLDMG